MGSATAAEGVYSSALFMNECFATNRNRAIPKLFLIPISRIVLIPRFLFVPLFSKVL